MARLSYQQLIDRHLEILRSLQYDSGLFAASDKGIGTGYDKSWLRDNFYETIAFEVIGDWDTVEKTYEAILQVLMKHEEKIDWAIENKPTESYQYIHARFHPETLDEFWESWGNKQNDAVGCILFRIGELEHHKKRTILKDEGHIRIINKLVKYLEVIEYWTDTDSGMWEEGEELHASSVGACVAGLSSISRLEKIEVPAELIENGRQALKDLLPRESEKKFVDLAQLSLIWPYNVVDEETADKILENVEYHLLRDRGIIRYKGDEYYNRNPDGVSEEAEWTFGFAWLAIIYQLRGQKEKAFTYIKDLIAVDTPQGLPELYFSNTAEYNDNTPLGWSESLFVVALFEMERGEGNIVTIGPDKKTSGLLPSSDTQISWITKEHLHARELKPLNLRSVKSRLLEADGKQAYGIDLGGDKIAGQILQVNNGELREADEQKTVNSDEGQGYLEFLEQAGHSALEKKIPVGISAAGPLEGTKLRVEPNMHKFGEEFEQMYQSDFAKLFMHPTVLNDAVAGIIAGGLEALRHYPEVENVLFIISGSGFGGALLHENKIYALEPGHIAIPDDVNIYGLTEACGVFGNDKPCIEKVASGKAGIETIYEQKTGVRKSGPQLAEMAQDGDEEVKALYENSARMIGLAVHGIGNVYELFEQPGRTAVVFHGGVFNVPGYGERLEKYLERELGNVPPIIYTKNMKNNTCLEGAAIAAITA